MEATCELHMGSPLAECDSCSNASYRGGKKKTSYREYKKEIYAALAACVAPVAMGSVIGFTSPATEGIRERFSTNSEDESLIGSLMTVGALIGGLTAGVVADYFGRKTTIMLNSIPYILGWLLIVSAQNVAMLYCSRILSGVCVGITCMTASVYIAEISSPAVRGLLGSCFQLFVNVGIMVAFILGKYMTWNYLALALMTLPTLQVLVMIPMPESPSWLIRNKRRLEALDSLRWLRSPHANVTAECEEIEQEQSREVKMALSDFAKPILWKPLLLLFVMMFGQQYSGINAVIFNAVPIFNKATKSIDSHDAAIIVAASMVAASIVANGLMDLAGRRILLMLSAVIMAISMVTLGLSYYLNDHDAAAATSVTFLPVASVVLFVSSFNLGFGPVPWLMMSEVFPSQARGIASGIITASNWTMAFVVTKTFTNMTDSMHEYGVYWLFAAVCVFSVGFVAKFVPETKGKTLDEVQCFFGGGSSQALLT